MQTPRFLRDRINFIASKLCSHRGSLPQSFAPTGAHSHRALLPQGFAPTDSRLCHPPQPNQCLLPPAHVGEAGAASICAHSSGV
ncbi:hypothetical protein B0E42_04480 [Pseudomonas sp. A25(2017)]|nr:hypothetical protein B0E42_04480 [Pseudomonas sp. A25(2017)]